MAKWVRLGAVLGGLGVILGRLDDDDDDDDDDDHP